MMMMMMDLTGCWQDGGNPGLVLRSAHLLEFNKNGLLDTAFLEIDARRVDHVLHDLRVHRADVLVRHLGCPCGRYPGCRARLLVCWFWFARSQGKPCGGRAMACGYRPFPMRATGIALRLFQSTAIAGRGAAQAARRNERCAEGLAPRSSEQRRWMCGDSASRLLRLQRRRKMP